MKTKQITIGAVLSYGAIAFNIIAGLLYTPWMIRTVGDDLYALYALAISVINIFLIDFGIGSAVTKFLSNYYALGDHAAANRFMGIVYKVFVAISVAIALCLFLFFFIIDGIYVKLTPEELKIFKRLFVIVASYSVLSFPFTPYNGILMANERFIAVKACGFGQKVFTVALIVAALLSGMSIYALVLSHAVSNVVFIAAKYFLIRRNTKLRADFSCKDKALAGDLFGYSVWVMVVNLAQRCIFNIMPTVIAALIGSAEVTLFSLAASLEGYVFSFADAINGMFMPKISRILVGENPENRLSDLMSKVGRFHVATIGLIYIGFVCVGRQFVGLWMGQGYEMVYVCALFLIFPSLIDVPQQVARTALLAKDIVKEQAIIYVIMAATNLVLCFVLIPALGIAGAAVSICAAYLLRTAAFNVLYRRKLGIDLAAYFKKTYLGWLPAGIISGGVGYCFIRCMDIGGWTGLIIKAFVIAAVYALLFFIFAIESGERKALYKFISGRKS